MEFIKIWKDRNDKLKEILENPMYNEKKHIKAYKLSIRLTARIEYAKQLLIIFTQSIKIF